MPVKRRASKAPIIDTTQDTLVIVESPAKAKTIKKYLGAWFEVTASMWHIVDLAKWNEAIDKENNFTPSYAVSSDKKAVVTALKKAAKAMKHVWLATDEDREWEAIAWHLCRELKLDVEKTPRIVFREITKPAIDEARKNLRTLDMDLVNAQQARRVLDRLVWFELSPVLWKKVKTWLSAWRVQSVAVKLLVEKEREIQKHEQQSTFKVHWLFTTSSWDSIKALMKGQCVDQKDVEARFEQFKASTFTIDDVVQKPGKKNPSSPLTTSWLQQAASTKLWYPVARTMQLAQRLYEAWLITYMRTDSMNLSKQALASAKKHITSTYWAKYSETRVFKSKSKGAQEAHECIRPTDFSREYAWADEQQKKLYHLIWQRTLWSQMAAAAVQKTTITINPSVWDDTFIAKGEVVTFDWFLALYDNKDPSEWLLPAVSVWETVERNIITAEQVYSKPPARFSEASLVKKLEELWIWRPSTYAPTISTIQRRWYVEAWINEGTHTAHAIWTLLGNNLDWSEDTKKLWSTKWRLVPTSVWMVVTDFLNEHFWEIMNYQFTASVEEEFDHIAHWELDRQKMIAKFYGPFRKTVESVTETADRASWERELWTDPKSWKTILVRIWRYWPLVQMWRQWDEDVTYASLPHGLQLETVTLQEAMEAFALPRVLGEWEWKPVRASIGRFGPYAQRWSTFASIKQPDDPYEIEYDRALELIKEKIEIDKAKLLQEFTYKEKEWIVKKWRRSHEIKWNRKTVRLPKWMDGAELSQADIEKIIEDELGSKKKKKPAKKKKATKKKATKKKTAAKKK